MLTEIDIARLPYRPCVGICLTNQDGKIWAGERIDTPGAWQMPQGGVDKGETPEVAASRELWEETGLERSAVNSIAQSDGWIPYDLPATLIPKLWNGKYRGQEQKWFHMELTGHDSLINIETEHPEFSRWQWMDAPMLLTSIVPFKEATYRKVLTHFGLL